MTPNEAAVLRAQIAAVDTIARAQTAQALALLDIEGMCGRLRVTVEGNTVSRGQKALEAPPPPAAAAIRRDGSRSWCLPPACR